MGHDPYDPHPPATSASDGPLAEVAALIQQHRDELLARWRDQVRRLPIARHLDVPTLNDHIPAVLEELTQALKSRRARPVVDLRLEDSPKVHGLERLRGGFDIVEVVAEYTILHEIVEALAEENGVDISGEMSRIINRVFDQAIAVAVDSYARQKTMEIQQRREEHISFVVHDLRTPLSAMEMASTILRKSLPAEVTAGRVANMLDVLERNAARLDALLKSAAQEQYKLAIGATDELRIERREIDLWPLVESLLRDLQPLAERSSIAIVNSVPHAFVVFADALLLTQVFQNLLSNAIRHTQHGHIIVGADMIEDRIPRCFVQDTGTGIEADRIEKVFEKLETDHQDEGSLGLGLPIVKKIVEAHGGEVFVESRPGIGSTFTFTLPPLV